MASLTLTVSLDSGTILKKVKFNATHQVYDALKVIEDKIFDGASGEGFGLFLTSAEDQKSGIWLEPEKTLEYYMLRDGDIVHYMNRIRTLRLRMLDGSVKTLKVDDSFAVKSLMVQVCSKIGVINHDEYALCAVITTRERDIKMVQLRKKLKTDEEVQWLDPNKTLREQSIDPSETLLLKRRLFFSDRNVDSRDPVQLNLLYVQARDAILDGTHPVTQEQAIQFAGIQCQVQFGDHDDVKHTCELIDSSLKDFLPEHYVRMRGIEKNILKEHKKHSSLSELDAKMLYIKNARSLTTYGVTFFLVKEKQKGKNKLVPRLLGINAESIIRVDENTRHILEIWPLTQVKKWAPTTTTFTLDFGEYSKQLYTVQTTEAPRIIEVLTGYIDIILKKKHGRDYQAVDLDKHGSLHQETVDPHNANMIEHISLSGQKPVTEHFTFSYQLAPPGSNKKVIKVQQNNPTQTKQATAGGIKRAACKMSMPHNDVVNELKMRQRSVPKLLNNINVSAQRMSALFEDCENLKAEDLDDEMDQMNKYVNELSQEMRVKTQDMDDKAKRIVMQQLEIISVSNKQLAALLLRNAKPAYNISEIQSTAANLCDASTKLYFLMDPETNRRSQLILSSRKSFLENDKADDKRMSQALNQGIADICDNVNAAETQLDKDDNQPILSTDHLLQLKTRAANNLAQANAAAAVLLAAHVDPTNVDYPAAVISINTISEIVPNIIGDIKLISRVMPEKKRTLMIKNLRNHCAVVKELCSSPNFHDIHKIHKAAQKFAFESERLFSNIDVDINPNLMHEIIRLAKVVGGKTSDLLLAANKAVVAADPDTSATIERATVDVTHSSRRLISCAKLTAPSIYEPHCQSAMLAATEGVCISTMTLERSWKPVIDSSKDQDLASDLAYRATEVENALDNLKAACKPPSTQFVFNIKDSQDDENAMEVDEEDQVGSYLKDVAEDATRKLHTAEQQLFDTKEKLLSGEDAKILEREIEEMLAVQNAAVGDLVMGQTDSKSNNKMSIIVAINTLASTLPLIVKGVRRLSSTSDDKLQTLFLLTRQLCSADPNNVNDIAVKYGEASSHVLYSICSHINPEDEKPIINLSAAIALKVSDLLNLTNDSMNTVQDETLKDNIEEAGVVCAETVQRFISCAKIISPTLPAPCCRISFISAIKQVKHALNNLKALISENKLLIDGWKDAENMLNTLQSESARSAAQSLLETNHKHLSEADSRTPRKDIEELASRVAEIAGTLQLAEQKAKDKPNDPKIQKEWEDAMNALEDTIKVMQRTSDQHNLIVDGFTVDPRSAHKLSSISDALVTECDPAVINQLVKNLIQDIEKFSKDQKSPRTQRLLQDFAQKLSAAARALQVTQRKLVSDPNDSNLQNELKKVVRNVQGIAQEVKASFQQLPQTEYKFTVTNKNYLKESIINEVLFKTDADNILQNNQPVVIKEITKNLLSNLQKESHNSKSNEERARLKYFSQKLAEAAQALEETENKAKACPHDIQIQSELQNAVKNIHAIANEIKNDVTTSIPTKGTQVSLPTFIHANTNKQTLKSATNKIINETNPEFIVCQIEVLYNDLKSLCEQQNSTQSKRSIEQLIKRLADASRALELAALKAKDKPQDLQSKIKLQTSIAEVHKIANEINENIIPIYEESNKTTRNIDLNNVQENIDLNSVQENVDPNNVQELKIFSDKINNTRDPKVVEDTSNLLLNNLKNIEMQKDVQNSISHKQDITDNLKKVIPIICNEESKPILCVKPNSMQHLKSNFVKLTNVFEPKTVNETTKQLLNDLKNLSSIQKSSQIRNDLNYHIQKLAEAAQNLEQIEIKIREKPFDKDLQDDILIAVTNIHNVANDLKTIIPPLCTEIQTSLLYVKPESIGNLNSKTKELSESTDPKVVGEITRKFITDLKGLSEIQSSDQTRKNLNYFAQKLAYAVRALEEADVKAKDKPRDVILQKDAQNSIVNIKRIVNELYKDIPLLSEEIKTFLPQNKEFHKTRTEDNLDRKKMISINMSPDSRNLLALSSDNLKNSKQLTDTKKLARLLITDLQNVCEAESASETRTYLKNNIKDLTEATTALQQAEQLTKEQPNDLSLKKQQQSALHKVHQIAEKIQREVHSSDTSYSMSREKRRSPKPIALPPLYAKTLIASSQAVLKHPPEHVGEHARRLINNIQNIDRTAITEEARINLNDYAKQMQALIQDIKIAETKLSAKSNHEQSRRELNNKSDELLKITSDFHNNIIAQSNPLIHNKSIKITPKLGKLLKSSADTIKPSLEPKQVEERATVLVNDIHNILKEEKSPEARKHLQYFAQKLADAAASLEVVVAKAKSKSNDINIKMELHSVVKHVCDIAEELKYSLECSTVQNSKINSCRPPIPARKSITEKQLFSNDAMDLINSERNWSVKCEQIPIDIQLMDPNTLQILSKTTEHLLKESDINNSIKHIDVLLANIKEDGPQKLKTKKRDYRSLEVFTEILAKAAKQLLDAENKFKIKPQDQDLEKKVEAAKFEFKALLEELQHKVNTENARMIKEEKQHVSQEISLTLIDAEELILKIKAIINDDSPVKVKTYAEAATHCIQKQAASQKTKEAREVLDRYVQKFNNAIEALERDPKVNTGENKDQNVSKRLYSLKDTAKEFNDNILNAIETQSDIIFNDNDLDKEMKQLIESLKNIDDNENYNINNQLIDYLIEQIRDVGQHQTMPDKRMLLNEYANKIDAARRVFVSAQKDVSNDKDAKKEKVRKASTELINNLHLIQNELFLIKKDNLYASPTEVRITLYDADALINNVNAAIKQEQISLIKPIIDNIRIQASKQKSDLAKNYLNQFAQRLSEGEKDFLKIERRPKPLPGLKTDILQVSTLKIMDALKDFQRDILTPLNKEKDNQLDQSTLPQTINSSINKEENLNATNKICITLTNAEELILKVKTIIMDDSPMKVLSYAEIVKKSIEKQADSQKTKEAQQVLDRYVQNFHIAIEDLKHAQKDNTGEHKEKNIKKCLCSLKEAAKEFNKNIIGSLKTQEEIEFSDDHRDNEMKQFIESLKNIDDKKQYNFNHQFIDSLIKQIRELGERQTIAEKRIMLEKYAIKVDSARNALVSAQNNALNLKDVKSNEKVKKESQELINMLYLIQNELLLLKEVNLKANPVEIIITVTDADALIDNVNAALKFKQMSFIKLINDGIRIQANNQKSDLAKGYLNQIAQRLSEAERELNEIERCHSTPSELKTNKLQEVRLKIMDTLQEFQRDILAPLCKDKDNILRQAEQTVSSLMNSKNIPDTLHQVDALVKHIEQMENASEMPKSRRQHLANYAQVLKASAEALKMAEQQAKRNPKDVTSQVAVNEAKVVLLKIANQYISVTEPIEELKPQKELSLSEVETKVIKRRVIHDLSRINTSALKLITEYDLQWSYVSSHEPHEGSKDLGLWNLQPNTRTDNKVIDNSCLTSLADELSTLCPRIYEDVRVLSETCIRDVSTDCRTKVNLIKNSVSSLCRPDHQHIQDVYHNFVLLEDATSSLIRLLDCAHDADSVVQLRSNAKEILDASMSAVDLTLSLSEKSSDSRLSACLHHQSKQYEQLVLQHYFNTMILSPVMNSLESKKIMASSISDIEENITKIGENVRKLPLEPKYMSDKEQILEQLQNSERMIKVTKDLTNNDVDAQSLYLLEIVEDLINSTRSNNAEHTQKVIQNVNLLTAIINNKPETQEGSALNKTKKYIEKLKVITAEINDIEAEAKKSPKDASTRKRMEESINMLHHLLLVFVLNKEMYSSTDVTQLMEGLSSENHILSSNVEDVMETSKGTADEKAAEILNLILLRNNRLNKKFKDVTSETIYAENAYEYIEAYKASYEELVLAENKASDRRTKAALRLCSIKIHSMCNSIIYLAAKFKTKHNCVFINNTLHTIDHLEKDIDILIKDDKTMESISKGNDIYTFYAHQAKQQICEQACHLLHTTNVNQVCLTMITHLCVFIHNMHLRINIAGPNDKIRLMISLRRIIFSVKILLVQIFNYYIYGPNGKFPLSYVRRILNEFIKELNIDLITKNDFVQNIQKICYFNAMDALESDPDTYTNIKKLKDKFKENVMKLNSLVSTISHDNSIREDHYKAQTEVTATLIVLSEQVTHLSRERAVTEQAAMHAALHKLSSTLTSVFWTSEFVHYNQSNITSRRSLTQSCFKFNDYLNDLVEKVLQSDLQEQCEGMLRNTNMLQVALHDISHPINGDGYVHSVDVIKTIRNELDKLNISNLNKNNLEKSLREDLDAMTKCVDYANQCTYLISISGTEQSIAQNGFIDTYTLLQLAIRVQASCISLQCTAIQADFEEICSDTIELTSVLCEASIKICDLIKARNISEGNRQEWSKDVGELARTASKFAIALQVEDGKINKADILSASISLNKAVRKMVILVMQTIFIPSSPDLTPEVAKHCHVITESTRNIIVKYTIYINSVKNKIVLSDTPATLDQTVVTSRTNFISAFDSLLEDLRKSGEKCALIAIGDRDEDTNVYLDTQINLSKRWLQKPKMVNYQSPGQEAVRNIIVLAETISNEFNDQDTDDVRQTMRDTKRLLEDCSSKPDEDKCRNLLDKTLELKRVIEKTVVNRVVKSLNNDDKVQDIKYTVLYETDDFAKHAALEEKISALLNHLNQMSATARVVVTIRGAGQPSSQSLLADTLKAELLAPKLVQAAKLSLGSPKDLALKDGFNFTFNEYHDTLNRVRDLCDRSVDPLDFVRSAGETIHKLSEKATDVADSRQAHRSNAEITRLANRVMLVGVSESSKTSDPELEKALKEAQQRLRAAIPSPDVRTSKVPDWTNTTSEILRGAREVESALGGENIFQQQLTSNQPIFLAAHALHACVREWSARDNDIVEAARRAAVLMAKLSTYMARDKKDASIQISKEIVEASNEVTRLARKLSLECTDLRIRRNLQQVSEQIPTISGQLKMLASVKATSKNDNVDGDMEAMSMLVDNAQNLMLSVEQVVQAAAAASVKIGSEKGPARMRWVRARTYC